MCVAEFVDGKIGDVKHIFRKTGDKMIRRAVITLQDDQMYGPRAVWASLPAGYEYNKPKSGDVSNTITGEVVAHIGLVSLNTYWAVANKSNSEGVQAFVTAYEQKNKTRFEDIPAQKLFLNLALVPDSNLHKLKRSVPPDYKVQRVFSVAGEERFLVTAIYNEKEEKVALVRVVDDRFEFEYEVNALSANHFESWLKANRSVTTK